MKHVLLALLTGLSALTFAGCNDDSDRPEVIEKLRGLGATTTPLVTTAAAGSVGAVGLTMYFALPPDQTFTMEPYVDVSSPFAITLGPEAYGTGTVTETSYPGLKLVTYTATLAVPALETVAALGGQAQVRYGFFVKAGDEEEKIIGSYLVYPDGAPELAWQQPAVTVVTPTEGLSLGSDSEVEVAATLDDKNDEELKLGWFATGGEIKNRRAKTTEWTTPDPGDHTLIFTAHGKKSRGFAMQIVTVKTQ